jgi:hypothetical protein
MNNILRLMSVFGAVVILLAAVGGVTTPSNEQRKAAIGLIPQGTRVVINAPAFRMDLFEDGKLTKTYKIGIGYPEFPLPTGLRIADTIIFSPTWTPPDEPWVESPNSKGEGGPEDRGRR